MRIAHGFLFCLVMAFATTSVCFAQNNPYQIDDECYKYMTEADRLIGKPGFDEQTSELKVVNVMVAVLLSVILLGGILGLYIYVRNLRKSQRKDLIMIAELTEANERARAADVANTQFIQIAQALGGSVYLDTGYTGGARFVFNIPVSGKTEE